MYLEVVGPEVVNDHEMIFIKAFILFYNYTSENLSEIVPYNPIHNYAIHFFVFHDKTLKTKSTSLNA